MILLQLVLYLSLLTSTTVLASSKRLFRDDDPVPISVKPLTFGGGSFDEKLYLYPVDYYHETLGHCNPKLQLDSVSNQTFFKDQYWGNDMSNAPFNTTFHDSKADCKLICDKKYKEANVTLINSLIAKNYKLNFYVDDIPVGRELYDPQTSRFYIDKGVPLGYFDIDRVPHLYNHFQFVIYYSTHGLDYKILYSTVSTQSLTRVPLIPLTCVLTPPLLLRKSDHAYNGNRITYSVIWKEVDLEAFKNFDSWDLYKNDVVRPFITNSLLFIFIILSIIIASYTYITIHKVLTQQKLTVIYKKREQQEQDESLKNIENLTEFDLIDDTLEFSWPSLNNDVFRSAIFSKFLYFAISQGVHITITLSLIIIQIGLGFIKFFGDRFTHVESTIISIFLITSPISSVVYTYLLKTFSNSISIYHLIISIISNVLTLPIFIYFIISQYNSIHKSTNLSPIQIPIDEILSSFIKKYLFATLLSFIISIKFIKPQIYHTSDISKKIASPPFTFQTIPNMIITGLFPFGVILIPLSTIYLALWYNHFYSDGSLLISYILLIGLIISISVLNVYHSLSIGNWKWQWYSFLSGASIGVYTFAYSFYLTKFKFGDEESFKLFLLQNTVISLILFLVGGTIAYTSSLIFVKKLYSGLV